MLRQLVKGLRISHSLGFRSIQTSAPAAGGHPEPDAYWGYDRIAGREVVGFGLNGAPMYMDRIDVPYPAVRFRKDDEIILKLREKEKGDWRNLTIDEKKLLYRYSFNRTFAELRAPDGSWKVVMAGTLLGFTLSLWFMWWVVRYVYKPLPRTFTNEYKEEMLERLIDLYADPITGYSSKYDYENDRWKA